MSMNRKLFLLIFCFTLFKYCHAQSWQSLGGGASFSVYALAVDSVRDELYVGGWFDRVGSTYVNGIAKWDGLNWHVLNGGVNSGGSVNTILIYNNEVYVGGNFDSIGGIAANNVARWDHSSWHPIGHGFNGTVFTLTVHMGEIYAGGNYSTSGINSANFLAKWNGSNWIDQGVGLTDPIWASVSYNNELIIAGVKSPMKWNGNSWQFIGTYLGSHVFKLKIVQGELYVGGRFARGNAPVIRYFSKWENNDWQVLPYPNVNNTLDPNVSDIIEYNGEIVITGSFKSPANIAKFNGTTYDSLSKGVSAAGNCLEIFRNDLIVGGIFNYAGNQVPGTSNLARWVLNTEIGETDDAERIIRLRINDDVISAIEIPESVYITGFEFEIFDLNGKSMESVSIRNGEKIYMKNYSPGLYLYRIIAGQKVFAGKFCII